MITVTVLIPRSGRLRVTALLFLFVLLFLLGACSGQPVTTDTSLVPDAVESPEPEIVLVAPDAEAVTPLGARRLILVIGDGMGLEQVKAASLYRTGTDVGLVMQSLPVYVEVATHSASHRITDSGAAATALATGVKVQNNAIGVHLPGQGEPLPLITAELAATGWRIGLVTTTFTTHATPAAFGAHVAHRNDYAGIAHDYLNLSRPHVIFGGGGFGMDPVTVAAAGYTVATNQNELLAATQSRDPEARIAGLFGRGHLPYVSDGRPAGMPGLLEMSRHAVEFLAQDGDAEFFLMIEGGRIDHAAHDNDIERMIPEMLELDDVVEMLLNHPLLQEDTLIVITGDHETGGLRVTESFGAGVIPAVTWSTTSHTGVDVPLYAAGVGAERFADIVDNTQLKGTMLAAREPQDTETLIVRDATQASEEVPTTQ